MASHMPHSPGLQSAFLAVEDTAGGRITQRRLRSGLRTSVLASVLGMFWVAVAFGVTTTMFMEALGVSGVMIGAAVTVQQLAMVVQIPAALFAERLSTRKWFWAIMASAHRLVWLLPPLLPFIFRHDLQRAAIWMLCILALSALLAHAATASWMSWMADLVPDAMKGRFWGRRQGATVMALLVATAFIGWLLDRFPAPSPQGGSFTGFAIAFILAAGFGTADILVHCLVPEPKPTVDTSGRRLWHRLLAPLQERDFRWLTLSMGSWTFSVGMVGSFGMVYLKRQFDASYLALTAIAIAASLGTTAVGPLWGRMMDRLGPRAFGGIMLFTAPLFGLIWFLVDDSLIALPWFGGGRHVPQPVFIIFFSSLAAGAFYSGVALCHFNLGGVLAPRQGRTVAMAMHWTLVGLMGAMGPICGGRLMDALAGKELPLTLPTGEPMAFFHVLVVLHILSVWLIALPLFTRISKRDIGELSLRSLVGNPLRALGTLQNIMAMDATCPKARAKAARNLGAQKAVAATTSLIPQMDDALSEVREAAVEALARIGTPEAVDALLDKLDDPETDLEETIVKALRETRDPRVAAPLLQRLREGHDALKSESARTLGNTGQTHLAPELLAMLKAERDPKLAVVYAEALAKMRRPEVLPELIRLLVDAQNTGSRQRRALLVCELLGDVKGFYELLAQEDKAPGFGVASRLNRLAKAGKFDAAGKRDVAKLLAEIEAAYDDGAYAQVVDLASRFATLSADDREREANAAWRPDCRPQDDALAQNELRRHGRHWFLRRLAEILATDETPDERQVEALLAIHLLGPPRG